MLPTKDEITALNIKELLIGDDNYVIPVYQRNYAWEQKEIEQLIQDVIDYARLHKSKNYYIGTLVVSGNKVDGMIQFDTIDGQQRLTTLSIISAVIRNEFSAQIDMSWYNKLNLRFASREKSTRSLSAAFEGNFDKEQHEENIKAAYKICKELLSKREKSEVKEEKITIEEFAEYLFRYVQILRVKLPEGIDLNHYFEIMNSRGEQLEKHEVLKAELMDCFNGYEPAQREILQSCFDLIWEACANMERYVQYGFTVDQRHIIFGTEDWNKLTVHSFDDFVEKVGPTIETSLYRNELSIDEILSGKIQPETKYESEDGPDKFNSVINFQNFLLHVLRVQLAKDEVALDDKRLLDIFKSQLPGNKKERIDFVKEFIYNLLKCKFLFDKYVIKREFTANTDRWSLKRLEWYSSGKTKNGVKYVNSFGAEAGDSYDSDNRRILMLLSMFHTSIPSMSYKYWLNASLYFLFNKYEIVAKDYIIYLEHIAKSFVFDNYLAIDPKSYFEMVFNYKEPIKRSVEHFDFQKLRYGSLNNNLIFNFLDYLLWLQNKDIENDQRVKKFEYKFRSSVEHFYPQNPIGGRKLNEVELHAFGNLCLISHSDNSKYSNYLPDAKSTHYNNKEDIDSIKQFLMIKKCLVTRTWLESEISLHNQEMLDLLLANMQSDYIPNKNISLAQKWFSEYQTKDRNLLVRALLSFGDCTKPVGYKRYQLYDFDYIRNHEVFQLFSDYIEEYNIKTLADVVNRRLKLQNIRNSWRYMFVKNKELLDYCEGGIIEWDEPSDGKLTYILKAQRNTRNSAVECMTYILHCRLKREHGIHTEIHNDCLSLFLKSSEEGYEITHYHNRELELKVWNYEGRCIDCQLILKEGINGNNSIIRILVEEYKWFRQEKGVYIRKNNNNLITLGEMFDENEELLFQGVVKLFKNGFGIRL